MSHRFNKHIALLLVVVAGCRNSPPDYAELMKGMGSPDPAVRANSAHRLGIYYHEGCSREGLPPIDDVIELLIDNLQDEDNNSRGQAIQALGNIGPDAKAAVPHLIEMIKKNDFRRTGAILSLGRMRGEAKDAIPILRQCAKDEEDRIRDFALHVIADIAPQEEATVLLLVEGLKDKSQRVRITAAEYLGRLGPFAESAIPALNIAATSEDEGLAARAKDALKKIRQK